MWNSIVLIPDHCLSFHLSETSSAMKTVTKSPAMGAVAFRIL